jgi:hypothetical protein
MLLLQTLTNLESYHKPTPQHNAIFKLNLQSVEWSTIPSSIDNTHSAFDTFYSCVTDLLNAHYPLRTVTLTSRDPPFMTPAIKAMLRHKNKLMRGGCLEEANALASRIGTGFSYC